MSINVPMEKFIRVLIWLKFIPVQQSQKDGSWSLHFTSLKFLIILATFLTATGIYINYTLHLLQSQNFQLTLSAWSDIIFKVISLNNAPLYIILLGPTACMQGNRLIRPGMKLPLCTMAYIVALTVLFNIGLVGIHMKTYSGDWTVLLPIAPAIFITFLSSLAGNLISFTWLNDFITSCPDGDKQELITVDECDAILELFQRLKYAIGNFCIVVLPYIQILLVFSLYNTLQGEIK